MLSQRCQYAVRAIFDLARRNEDGPVTTAKIAAAQAIPEQFLEVIMGELKQGGLVASKRGRRGGYVLARGPEEVTVGEVILLISGPLGPVECVHRDPAGKCALAGDCAFLTLWREVNEAAASVYDGVTFAELVAGCPGLGAVPEADE